MILDDSLFSGVVDFTGGSLSNVIGITGTGVLGDNTVYDISPTLILGLTSGLSVTAFESGVLLPNTTITSVGSTTITLSNPVEYEGSTKFFISYYLLSGVVYASIRDDLNGSAEISFPAFNIFPMQNSYLRFGSSPDFFLETIDQTISVANVKRFDGKLLQVDIYNTLSKTTSWSNYPAVKSGVSLYQMYANSSIKKISVATKGSFELTISLANLLKSLDIF